MYWICFPCHCHTLGVLLLTSKRVMLHGKEFSDDLRLGDQSCSVLYTGVTSDLALRIHQHRRGEGSRFCRWYALHDLVYCETYDLIVEAIHREKNTQAQYHVP